MEGRKGGKEGGREGRKGRLRVEGPSDKERVPSEPQLKPALPWEEAKPKVENEAGG